MPEQPDSLERSVWRLEGAVSTFTENVKALTRLVEKLEQSMVTRGEFKALAEKVEENREDADAGIKRNDDRWEKLLWFVFLAVGAALLGLVITQGGKP